VPARTNFFQDVVALLHRALDPAAVVEESKMLPSRTTGSLREVDVLLTSKVGGHPVMVGIEARHSKRKATVEWVEQQMCKHDDLGTSKLVLVSGSGFTPDAAARAKAHGIVAMTPALLSSVSSPTVDQELRYLTLTGLGSAAKVREPSGRLLWLENVDTLTVFDQSGVAMTVVSDLCHNSLVALLESAEHESSLWQVPAAPGHPAGYRTVAVDLTKLLVGGWPQPAYLRFVDDDGGVERFDQILGLHLQVRGDVARAAVSLAQRLFGDATVTYGTIPHPGLVTGTATLVRVEESTDTEDRGKITYTVRLRPPGGHGPAQDFPLHSLR
jgi:hypothetical protein